MATTQKITTGTPWFRLDLQDADWKAEDPKDLQRWMEQLLLIRRF
jgi:2-oxoisovalerate dehydrogenase E1 component